jgi:cell division protein FtsB
MKKRIKKISIYALILLVIFAPGFIKYCKLYRQREINQAKLAALMEENKRLAEENRKLKEDPVYIEKMARDILGLAKKDEFVVKSIDTNAEKR